MRFLLDLHVRLLLEAHLADATQHAEFAGVKTLAVVDDVDFRVDRQQHEVAEVVVVDIAAE